MLNNFKPATLSPADIGYVCVNAETNNNIVERLPSGIYDIVFSTSMKGAKLEILPRTEKLFPLPKKIYGMDNDANHIDIVEATRARESGNIAVALVGLKGSGKTLHAKYLANTIIESKGGVCLWMTGAVPESVIRKLCSVNENVVILFDEFDRKYPVRSDDRLDQEDLLSVLSEDYPNNVTFLLTANTGVNGYYRDRPKRIRFLLEYKLLESYIIEEVLAEAKLEPYAELYVRLMFRSTVPDCTESVKGDVAGDHKVRSFASLITEDTSRSLMPSDTAMLPLKHDEGLIDLPSTYGDTSNQMGTLLGRYPVIGSYTRGSQKAESDKTDTSDDDKAGYNLDTLITVVNAFKSGKGFVYIARMLRALNIPTSEFSKGVSIASVLFTSAPCAYTGGDTITVYSYEEANPLKDIKRDLNFRLKPGINIDSFIDICEPVEERREGHPFGNMDSEVLEKARVSVKRLSEVL